MIYNFHRTILFREGNYLKVPYSIDNFGNDAVNLVKGYTSLIQAYIENPGTTHDIIRDSKTYQVHVDNINISGIIEKFFEIKFHVRFIQDSIDKISEARIIVEQRENVFLIKEIIQ
jgi:hypothetical protein